MAPTRVSKRRRALLEVDYTRFPDSKAVRMKYANIKGSHTAATADKLGGAVEERLRNQIGRAFRHTYGAESGLRTLVRLASSQMLAAGAARGSVRRAITLCIENHPGCSTGRPSLVSGEARSVTLERLMLTWADEVFESNGARVLP